MTISVSSCRRGCAALILLIAFVVVRTPRVSTHGSITTTVLFDREIVRVLNDHCVMCHTAQGPAFPLETYEQTWARGQVIRTSVLQHHMPPWGAVAGYGSFKNANSLTLRESQFVISWVEGLGPRNAGSVFLNVANSTARPAEPMRAAAHVGHWQAGEPELKVQLPPANVAAGQADSVTQTTVELPLQADRRVRSIEFMPGDRRVVRAAVFTLAQTGQWLGSWTPWYGFVTAPEGAAFRLPANARIVAELHYRGTSEAIVDRGTLGLSFAPADASQPIADLTLRGVPDPRASLSTYVQRASTRLASNTSVWALVPRLDPGLRSIQVTARMPDGGTDILLFAKDPPVEWPTPYILARPVLLPAGTQVSVSARYDRAPPKPFLLTISRYAPRASRVAK